MRCLVFAMALARTQMVPMPRPGIVARVLMEIGVPAPIERFAGTFYGVTASVDLNMRTRVAIVRLSGAPLGGSISGTGWLKSPEAESGTVVIDPEFSKQLSRRFISISSAHLDRQRHTVTVNVKVPILGLVALVLT
tara:strand:+ start:57 stop:464 length:408 start_codon:yes stop_codon:yes gene_type:complete